MGIISERELEIQYKKTATNKKGKGKGDLMAGLSTLKSDVRGMMSGSAKRRVMTVEKRKRNRETKKEIDNERQRQRDGDRERQRLKHLE